MHYAWRIAHGDIAPESVESRAGVDIAWTHRTPTGQIDRPASRAAAQALIGQSGFHMQHPAALHSRHELRLAIDMTVTWLEPITVTNADPDAENRTVTLPPGDSVTGTALHAIGASYGVIKLVSDPPHWSDNGH
jgi:hypothetical protein